jgi:hypothetical protein
MKEKIEKVFWNSVELVITLMLGAILITGTNIILNILR